MKKKIMALRASREVGPNSQSIGEVNAGLTRLALFVREGMPNAYDEGYDPKKYKVKVVFREHEIIGSEKALIDQLCFKQHIERIKYIIESDQDKNKYLSKSDSVISNLNDPTQPIHLEISDFNTHGLCGKWNDERHSEDNKANFYNFIYDTGDSKNIEALLIKDLWDMES